MASSVLVCSMQAMMIIRLSVASQSGQKDFIISATGHLNIINSAALIIALLLLSIIIYAIYSMITYKGYLTTLKIYTGFSSTRPTKPSDNVHFCCY